MNPAFGMTIGAALHREFLILARAEVRRSKAIQRRRMIDRIWSSSELARSGSAGSPPNRAAW
jgi:hypothetical protein